MEKRRSRQRVRDARRSNMAMIWPPATQRSISRCWITCVLSSRPPPQPAPVVATTMMQEHVSITAAPPKPTVHAGSIPMGTAARRCGAVVSHFQPHRGSRKSHQPGSLKPASAGHVPAMVRAIVARAGVLRVATPGTANGGAPLCLQDGHRGDGSAVHQSRHRQGPSARGLL